MLPDPMSPTLKRALWVTALASLIVRLAIAATLPITGDEALFYQWGLRPEWGGYYDHPPMAGWWIAASIALFGDSTFSIRLPAVLLPLSGGALLWWTFSPLDRVRTAWAVLLFWLTPINWINVLITTDTPVIFFSLASVCLLFAAERRPRLDATAFAAYAGSGLMLSGALFSKYFAVVLALCIAVYFLGWRRDRLAGLGVMVLTSLPGPLVNLAWNMSHGWPNIMFNVFNRNEGETFAWKKPLLYLASWLYLLMPIGVALLWKYRSSLRQRLSTPPMALLGCLIAVSWVFFALLSAKKVVGLHWVVSFLPFWFVALAWALPTPDLRRTGRWFAGFTAVHLLLLAGLYAAPLSAWSSFNVYPKLVRSLRTEALVKQVDAPDVAIMATGYTSSVIYAHALKRYVPTFAVGSHHARQDDLWVNFGDYDGRTIRIIGFEAPDLDDYRAYFESVSLLTFEQEGVPFYAVHGTGFRAEVYRERVIGEIMRRFHRIPAWLPMTGCPICERYCAQVRCEVGTR